MASTHLAHNEIKVVSSQKTENQFVLDVYYIISFKKNYMTYLIL
jgi:hypothetical protein